LKTFVGKVSKASERLRKKQSTVAAAMETNIHDVDDMSQSCRPNGSIVLIAGRQIKRKYFHGTWVAGLSLKTEYGDESRIWGLTSFNTKSHGFLDENKV
jgi:hypothetical protein